MTSSTASTVVGVPSVASSASTVACPTAPSTTPRTDASLDGNEDIPPLDLNAVASALETVQEEAIEQAEFAKLPKVPHNTPAASVVSDSIARPNRYNLAGFAMLRASLWRGNDTSSITPGNRLSSVTEGSVLGDTESSGNYGSDFSATPAASATATATANGTHEPNTGTILIALGSPRTNPLIDEYVNAVDNDSAALELKDINKRGNRAIKVNTGQRHYDTHSLGANRTGVLEKTTWGDATEDDAERALKRLEQLASDEVRLPGATQSFEDIYLDRLQRLLAADHRRVKVTIKRAE